MTEKEWATIYFPSQWITYRIQNYVNVYSGAEQQYLSQEERRTASPQPIKQSEAGAHEGKESLSHIISMTTTVYVELLLDLELSSV